MNHGTDPQPTSRSWHQVSIQFDDYSAAEHTGVAHIGPEMTSAETAGLIASWFFIRKAPCWRLRVLLSHDRTEQDATTFIHQRLRTLQDAGRIASWVETSYEPEMYAFGGAAAMDLAHHLFHSDSRYILAYLGSDRATTSWGRSDQRRELSILLCSILMRGAGQDWYEQGDIWARVAENRSLPPDTPLDRLRTMESDLRQLMTVNASPLMKENGPLTFLPGWAAAFAEAGRTLGDLARDGTLSMRCASRPRPPRHLPLEPNRPALRDTKHPRQRGQSSRPGTVTGEMSQHALLRSKLVDWFPLLPRTRPPGQALHLRVDEIRGLACSASQGPTEIRMSSAAEALNKAALITSDCGLVDLAQQLCWRQFDIFQAATPLTAKTAKLALQPIVNLGRLATRGGDGARAYRIFENAYDAVRTQAATEIDGRDIDFRQFVSQPEERQEIRKFLWTILLADGTRALTKAGRWGDALRHIEQYKGIGKRMLDGRQVAILARCTTGDHDAAIDMLDDSSTPDPWEEAVATCLRTLCLRIGNQPADTSAAAMVRAYLRLEPSREHLVFRTRLGLCVIDLGVIDLAADAHRAGTSQVIARVIREAVAGADAYSASDVLSHELCRSSMAEADKDALAAIVELSGLRRATMPANLLEDLMTSAKTSQAQLAQVLARDTHHPSTA